MARVVDSEDIETFNKIDEEKKTLQTKVSHIPPAGYVPIQLSTEGSFGVPKKIWVKNFSTEDVLYLSMASDELLPEYLIPVLNANIWNPDNTINVAMWTEPQIVEVLIKFYANFFSSQITDINFPISKEDIEFIDKPENEIIKKQLDSGWKPLINLDLTKINFFDLKKSPVKEYIRVKHNTLNVLFGIPRFGDTLSLKKVLKDKFSETDDKYEKMRKKEEDLTSEQRLEIEKYFLEKSMYITTVTKFYYLKEIDGKDISGLSLLEKINTYQSDARLDVLVLRSYEKALDKLKYGIDPMVEVMNPFTQKPCSRRFVFRPFNLLQIILVSEPDEYDVQYE